MRSFGSAFAIFKISPRKCCVSGCQQLLPVGRHHVVVGRRNRRRDRDLEFDARRNVAGLLQSLEDLPRLDCHGGVAGVERRGINGGAGLHPEPRNLAHHLAIPLHKLERRHVGRKLDRRVAGQHVLQKPDPALADAGLAVRQPDEVRPDRFGQRPEHGLAVGQRNAADEMHDRMPATVCHRGAPLSCGTADISATTFWRGSPRRFRPRPDRSGLPCGPGRPSPAPPRSTPRGAR